MVFSFFHIVVFDENDPIEKLVNFVSGKLEENTTDRIPGDNSPYQSENPYNVFVAEVSRLRRNNTALENEAHNLRNLIYNIINATAGCGTCSDAIQNILQQNN